MSDHYFYIKGYDTEGQKRSCFHIAKDADQAELYVQKLWLNGQPIKRDTKFEPHIYRVQKIFGRNFIGRALYRVFIYIVRTPDAEELRRDWKKKEATGIRRSRSQWVIFLACILAAYIAGKIINLDNINWKAIDLFTLGLGSVGFFSLVSASQRVIPVNELSWRLPQTENAIKFLAIHCRHAAGIIDGLQSDGQLSETLALELSNWTKQGIDFQTERKLPDIADWYSCRPKPTKVDWLDEKLATVNEYANSYIESRSNYLKTLEIAEGNSFDDLVTITAPFFIACAIGLAFFKILYGS